MSVQSPRLALGTAQFGMAYGVMNETGRAVPRDEVARILAVAWNAGIELLDTAVVYGDAAEVIASALPPQSSFAAITKMRALDEDARPAQVGALADEIRQSQARLAIPEFYAVLVHHASDLLGPSGPSIYQVLTELRAEGTAARIGVSVYDPQTLMAALDRYPLDLVQLPLNVLDQRFFRDGTIAWLKSHGVEVHVRSVFLQGVLLAENGRLPRPLSAVRHKIAGYHIGCRHAGLSAAASALHFVLSCPGVDRIVIGVDSLANLRDNIHAYEDACRWEGEFDYAPYMVEEADIVDPRRWRTTDRPS